MNSADLFIPTDATEKRFIRCIWRVDELHQRPCTETILPKGTVELIFNFSDRITHVDLETGTATVLPDLFLNGINFRPFQLQKQGRQHFLGIQLTTFGMRGLFGAGVGAYHDKVVGGAHVCRSLHALFGQVQARKAFSEQVLVIRAWLERRIAASRSSDRVGRMHDLFSFDRPGELDVARLCREKGVSDRQLRRLSTEWLGMNTETFLLYRKYRAALYLLHRTGFSLGQVGLEAGYYDQSHFIREFRSFTGMTPTAYRASVTGLPGHILG